MSGQRGDDQELVNEPEVVLARVGEEIAVTVADLPGAGYEWVTRELPIGLTELGVEWAEPMPSGVGAARRRTLRFRADRPGAFDVVLDLRRPWEQDRPPARSRVVQVRVTDARS